MGTLTAVNTPNAVIESVVSDFIRRKDMFTSVDIGNTIKREFPSSVIRNRDVAEWLRGHVVDLAIRLTISYATEPITVHSEGQDKTATLYLPTCTDPCDYTERDQVADIPNSPVSTDDEDDVGGGATDFLPTPMPSLRYVPPLISIITDLMDRRGNLIDVGDVVCYPVRKGSSMWMKDITVTDVDVHLGRIKGTNENERIVTVTKLSRVTKIS